MGFSCISLTFLKILNFPDPAQNSLTLNFPWPVATLKILKCDLLMPVPASHNYNNTGVMSPCVICTWHVYSHYFHFQTTFTFSYRLCRNHLMANCLKINLSDAPRWPAPTPLPITCSVTWLATGHDNLCYDLDFTTCWSGVTEVIYMLLWCNGCIVLSATRL